MGTPTKKKLKLNLRRDVGHVLCLNLGTFATFQVPLSSSPASVGMAYTLASETSPVSHKRLSLSAGPLSYHV